MDSHMEHAHPQGPENQNIIEAIGMPPERFAEISEDVKSHIFTSPAYLQRNHELSEEEADAVLLELQHQGFVTTDHIDGSYGVFPDGVESRELTPQRKRQTSKLGRAVLGPIKQASKEYVNLTKLRVDKVTRFVSDAPKLEEKDREQRLAESKREQKAELEESYKQSVEEARSRQSDPTKRSSAVKKTGPEASMQRGRGREGRKTPEDEYNEKLAAYNEMLDKATRFLDDPTYGRLFERDALVQLHDAIQAEAAPFYQAELDKLNEHIDKVNRLLGSDQKKPHLTEITDIPYERRQEIITPIDSRHTRDFVGTDAPAEILESLTLARLIAVGKIKEPRKPQPKK
jgi:hypothetical protein